MDSEARESFKRSYGRVRTAAQQRRLEFVPAVSTMAGRSAFNLGNILREALSSKRAVLAERK
jgi:hypothetical protein